ncbi:transglutaminase family protein [Tropicimonas isoalkanivorans]|uniref:Transglutaminase-like enzyme, putative cysteine protease n=1 Tax=Tropicimonas isoalkanivorans TaxID=441112 RepID=A0A1I1JSJ1_9RHOB|nr:transglutaminase family protein [Tropicimonas isoalkanivorans]SFC51607.1 Transglutaminase-like enzyme, putative cysteine protease [Tropicimonas isoalkanivorans]
MRLTIQHRTTYTYTRPVTFALQQLRLTPKQGIGQRVLTWQTLVEGGQKELEYDDHNRNHVMLVSYGGEGHKIVVICQGTVETSDNNGVVGHQAGFAPLWYFRRQTPLTKQGMGIRSLVKGLSAEVEDPIARCHALSARVLEAIDYKTGHTDARTTAEEALAQGAGVCQDHAHVFIAAARQLGFPARYVSGYLLLEGQQSQEAAHAWAEVYFDSLGWVGFDVPNSICPDDRYVRVATGLDYSEAAPISGLHTGEPEGEAIDVDIQVQQ